MEYQEKWDLSTIPNDAFASEYGRRQRAKGPKATNVVLKPCPNCGTQLTTVQRRKPACPECGAKQRRT